MMSDDLTALIFELQRAPTPADKAKALARAWRTVRGLKPAERRLLAREVGFDGAEELIDGLGGSERGIFAPAAVLEALQKRGVDAHAWDPRERSMVDFGTAGFDRAWIALHGPGGEDGSTRASGNLRPQQRHCRRRVPGAAHPAGTCDRPGRHSGRRYCRRSPALRLAPRRASRPS